MSRRPGAWAGRRVWGAGSRSSWQSCWGKTGRVSCERGMIGTGRNGTGMSGWKGYGCGGCLG